MFQRDTKIFISLAIPHNEKTDNIVIQTSIVIVSINSIPKHHFQIICVKTFSSCFA